MPFTSVFTEHFKLTGVDDVHVVSHTAFLAHDLVFPELLELKISNKLHQFVERKAKEERKFLEEVDQFFILHKLGFLLLLKYC